MQVEFSALPATARVWIYQADRVLTAAEVAEVEPLLGQFADDWTSHGRALRAAAAFRHGWFLVIGLDESAAGASGCSIDSSVRFVRGLEQRLGVGLLGKTALAFQRGEKIELFQLADLRAAIAVGKLDEGALFFNNTLTVKGNLENKWPAPAGQTWLARYFLAAEKK